MIEPHAECLFHFGRRLARWTKIKKFFEDVMTSIGEDLCHLQLSCSVTN
jgi:hypothetical protein